MMLSAERIEQEAKQWCNSGLKIDESDRRAVTSFARWLIKLASEEPSSGSTDNSLTSPDDMGFPE